MNKYYIILFLILSFLLAGCSEETPSIVKKDMSGNEEESVELVEQPSDEDEDEVDMVIEFTLADEQIMIDLNQVPILKNFLAQIEHRQQAIDNMKLEKIDISSKDSLYLLKFSSNEDIGSYLLLDRTDQGSSFLLADLATLSDIVPSADASKLLFMFKRQNADQSWQTNKIMVIDVANFTPISLTNDKEIKTNTFSWPIESVSWQDDDSIIVNIPAIEEPSSELLNAWVETEKITQEIILETE